MKEDKKLEKHPIKYATEYIGELLEKQKKPEVIERITFAVRDNTILVTCKDEETYKILKKVEKKVDKEIIAKLGMKGVRFQWDRYYLVLKIIKEFSKAERTEFRLEEMVIEVNKYEPERTSQAVRDLLAFYATEFEEYWRSMGYNYPEELMEARGLKAIISRQKKGVHQIFIKKGKTPKPKPKVRYDLDEIIFSDF